MGGGAMRPDKSARKRAHASSRMGGAPRRGAGPLSMAIFPLSLQPEHRKNDRNPRNSMKNAPPEPRIAAGGAQDHTTPVTAACNAPQ